MTLFDDGNHTVNCFTNLVKGEGVQTNQMLIRNGDSAVLFDPGGDLTYTALTFAVSRFVSFEALDYVFLSHQDPDAVASINHWLLKTRCKIIVSRLWEGFLPHLISKQRLTQSGQSISERIVAVPDDGGILKLNGQSLQVVPSHFLHSPGSLSLYDPKARVLFSGDIGASMVAPDSEPSFDDFEAHIPAMRPFHQRYMASKIAARLWCARIRTLDVEILVPQHGKLFRGEQVGQFLDWFETLDCGVDLMSLENIGMSTDYLDRQPS
jgi:flavorubredoxin